MTNHLQTEFESYMAAVDVTSDTPELFQAMRQAFFAGAVAALAAPGVKSPLDIVREIQRYSAECHDAAEIYRRRN